MGRRIPLIPISLALVTALLPAAISKSADRVECEKVQATIVGTDQSETIQGTAGKDVIAALAGDDTVLPSAGADIVCGGAGDDRLSGGAGPNVLNGGSGIDIVTHETSGGPRQVDLGVNGRPGSSIDLLGSDKDTLRAIENIEGSPFADVLAGGPGPNEIAGGNGNDTFVWFLSDTDLDSWDGGQGNDTVNFNRAPGPVEADLSAETASLSGEVDDAKSIAGFEALEGSFFSDFLTGDEVRNEIFSWDRPFNQTSGDGDTIFGLGGNDLLVGSVGPAHLDGGEGNDDLGTVAYDPVVLIGGGGDDELSGFKSPRSTTGFASFISYSNGASFYDGGAGSDRIDGSFGEDIIQGGTGDDRLFGADGDDFLDGGPGIDHGGGGLGSDVCEAVETWSGCAAGEQPDNELGGPAQPGSQADVIVAMAPEASTRPGTAYSVSVRNDGPAGVQGVVVRFYANGRVLGIDERSSGGRCSDDVHTHELFGAYAECRFDELPVGSTRTFVVDVDEIATDSPMHMVLAHQNFFPPTRDPDWSNNSVVFSGSTTFRWVQVDVGQGDAAVFQGPCGETGVLDAPSGHSDDVLDVLDNSFQTRELEWVAVSHYDADHLGGLLSRGGETGLLVSDGVTVKRVYDRGGDKTVGDGEDEQQEEELNETIYRQYRKWAGKKRVGLKINDPSFTLCDGPQKVEFKVISVGEKNESPGTKPIWTAARGVEVREENDKGLCLKVTYGNFKGATCGDINGTDEGKRTDVESAAAADMGAVDFVKVNHHGSKFSSNCTFVETLAPAAAVVSVGKNPPRWGHPDPDVLSRWQQVTVSNGGVSGVYQTEDGDGNVVHGDVTLTTDGRTDFKISARDPQGSDPASPLITSYPLTRSVQPKACEPVIFIHGFMGAEMFCGDEEVWPAVKTTAGIPTGIGKVEKLTLLSDGIRDDGCKARWRRKTTTGVASGQGARPREPIGRIAGEDIYESMIRYLEKLEGVNPYFHAYDWRKNVYDWQQPRDPATIDLDALVDSALKETNSNKVTLLAHSMGGLLARAYIDDPALAAKISRVVTLGTPYWGAPKAWLPLVHGVQNPTLGLSDVSGYSELKELYANFLLGREGAKELSRNMGGLYRLLPSEEYTGRHTWLFVGSKNALGEGRGVWIGRDAGSVQQHIGEPPINGNTSLVSAAYFSHREINGFETNGVDYRVIVGTGLPTVVKFLEDTKFADSDVGIRLGNGDKTVPVSSAVQGEIGGPYLGEPVDITYVCGVDHSALTSNQAVLGALTPLLLQGDAGSLDALNDPCIAKGSIVTIRSGGSGTAVVDGPPGGGGNRRSLRQTTEVNDLSLGQAEKAGLLEILEVSADRVILITNERIPVDIEVSAPDVTAEVIEGAEDENDRPMFFGPAAELSVVSGPTMTVSSNGVAMPPAAPDTTPPATKGRVVRKKRTIFVTLRASDSSGVAGIYVGTRERRFHHGNTERISFRGKRSSTKLRQLRFQAIDVFGNLESIKRIKE